jgi:hypothetical protein
VNSDVPLRTELTRAYTRIFGSRGGFSPTAGREVIPVQVMDGPSWPAGRRWATSESVAGVAAQNSIVQIDNNDPLDSGSLVCIDWARLGVGAASDVIIGFAAIGTVAYGSGPFATPDIAPAPPGSANIANVRHGQSNQAFSPSGFRIFGITAFYELHPTMPGITLSPQQTLLLSCVVVNTAFTVSIGGRYYSGL